MRWPAARTARSLPRPAGRRTRASARTATAAAARSPTPMPAPVRQAQRSGLRGGVVRLRPRRRPSTVQESKRKQPPGGVTLVFCYVLIPFDGDLHVPCAGLVARPESQDGVASCTMGSVAREPLEPPRASCPVCPFMRWRDSSACGPRARCVLIWVECRFVR